MMSSNSNDYLSIIEELETIRSTMESGSEVYEMISDRIEVYKRLLHQY
jgi:hypothetical protein